MDFRQGLGLLALAAYPYSSLSSPLPVIDDGDDN